MATSSHFITKRRELTRIMLSRSPESGSPSLPGWMESGRHHECGWLRVAGAPRTGAHAAQIMRGTGVGTGLDGVWTDPNM